jgi:hypothetical protein
MLLMVFILLNTMFFSWEEHGIHVLPIDVLLRDFSIQLSCKCVFLMSPPRVGAVPQIIIHMHHAWEAGAQKGLCEIPGILVDTVKTR